MHLKGPQVRWRILRRQGAKSANRLLVDLAADRRVTVSVWPHGGTPNSVAEVHSLAWPLDGEALEDLRWYLEDYLRTPFGVYEDRGPAVRARLKGWGEAMFAAVFGAGPAGDAYRRTRASSSVVEVVFRSGSPRLLGLPWELMRDPERPTPLAVDLAGLDRSLPGASWWTRFRHRVSGCGC